MPRPTTTYIASPEGLCYNGRSEVLTVRFGKKSRNLAAAGRRLFGERPQQDRQAAGLAVQTLEPIVDEETMMTPPSPEEPRVAGDPTQRLLTALGRFQRQVTRAEEGAPQEAWCDECMNQLITGIEIALGEDWDDVKEALTDTARILQTYEDAGQAGQCVGFLKESYEILCLMVGDLIVGNVRSGVMKKWENRYERALDDLAAAGLTLIDDDGPVERETAHAPARPGMDDFDHILDDASGMPGSVFDDAPAPSATARAFASDPGDPFAPVDLGEHDSEGDSPFDSPAHGNRRQEEDHSAPSLDELLGRPVSSGDDLEDELTPDAGTQPELTDDFTAETEPSFNAHAGADAPDSGDDSGDAAAFWDGQAVDSPAEPEDTGLDEGPEAPIEDAAPQVDDTAPPEEPAVARAPATAPAPAAVQPAPEPEPEPGTPEALLRTAQRAMAAGNVSDAKLFALQLAVNMARLEANQVAERIALVESDIARNRDAVASGELAVHEAEERVRRLEEEVGRCRQEFEDKQRRIEELRGEVAAAEGTVEDLNRQIAELEARRDAEAERLAGIQSNLNDSIGEEQRMQAELESLVEEESGSRENLDGARDHVRALQESGAAHEARLAETQTEFARREKAVEDIETTLRHVTGEPEPAAEAPVNEESALESDASDAGSDASGHEEAHAPQQTELLPPDEGNGDGGEGAGNDAPQEHAS